MRRVSLVIAAALAAVLAVVAAPVVANKMVYVGGAGMVYAFALPTNSNQAAARPRTSRVKPNRSLRPTKGTP